VIKGDFTMTLDFVFKTCTGHDTAYWAEQGDLDWFDKYADPRRDAGKGVLVANWNEFPRKGDKQFNWSSKGRKFQSILEQMGYELDWSDQTSRCEHCNGAITEGPDYYGDTAHYAILGECVVCENCIRTDFTEEYLESLEDNPRRAVHIHGIDPTQHGYELLQDGFESGFHPGQNDSPEKIFRTLRDAGHTGLLFAITDSGQFDVRFAVYKRVAE
jgi:hypothetical protein